MPNRTSLAKDVWRGVRRHPWKSIRNAFTAFSVLFTVIKGVTHFVPGVTMTGLWPLLTVVVVSLTYALKKAWKPSQVVISIPNTNTSIELHFGDIFDQDGLKAIAVNEFFDSELGVPVSERSLHGMFLKKCFGGHPQPFDNEVKAALVNVKGKTSKKTIGKTIAYPIGTTVPVSVDGDKYLAFAFARSHIDTCKAFCDVTTMWDALHGLWQQARIESGGASVNLPLVGSGLSGLGLPTRDLLNLIILSAITETKSKSITGTIRIVLHRDRCDEVDLAEVKDYWEM